MKNLLNFASLIFSLYLLSCSGIWAKSPEMVLIPAGSFTMGNDNRAEDEKPAHSVYINEFQIGKYEVTNREYYQFVLKHPRHRPESFSREHGIGSWPERALKFPEQPVVGISWHDAVAYAKSVEMRLPTEAEWEKANRGLTDRYWPWGSAPAPRANVWSPDAPNGLTAVGSYPEGKSFYGVLDMAGNVWEWTADWYSDTYYYTTPKQNPKGAKKGTWRIIRGGSWVDAPHRCTTTFRFYFYPSLKSSFVGFRLAKSADSAEN